MTVRESEEWREYKRWRREVFLPAIEARLDAWRARYRERFLS